MAFLLFTSHVDFVSMDSSSEGFPASRDPSASEFICCQHLATDCQLKPAVGFSFTVPESFQHLPLLRLLFS